jgi:hypothetical protein
MLGAIRIIGPEPALHTRIRNADQPERRRIVDRRRDRVDYLDQQRPRRIPRRVHFSVPERAALRLGGLRGAVGREIRVDGLLVARERKRLLHSHIRIR